MGKTAGKGTNSKKEAGNAKKAAVAAEKSAKDQATKAAAEDREWNKGAKNDNKKAEADAKKADAARKKAERDAQLAAETEGARSRPKGENKKTAVKKSKGLDLSQLDPSSSSSTDHTTTTALNASNLDDALSALDIAAGQDVKIDRHPERRYKSAYAAFEARRLPEVESENPGLRRNQRVELVRKEFEKSEENPFNQVAGRFDMSREEMRELRGRVREGVEGRLGSP